MRLLYSGGAHEAISMSTPDQQGQRSLDTSAKMNLARVLSKWDPQRAVQLHSQLHAGGHSVSSPEMLLAHGQALAATGQLPEAADVLHEARKAASSSEVNNIQCWTDGIALNICFHDLHGQELWHG